MIILALSNKQSHQLWKHPAATALFVSCLPLLDLAFAATIVGFATATTSVEQSFADLLARFATTINCFTTYWHKGIHLLGGQFCFSDYCDPVIRWRRHRSSIQPQLVWARWHHRIFTEFSKHKLPFRMFKVEVATFDINCNNVFHWSQIKVFVHIVFLQHFVPHFLLWYLFSQCDGFSKAIGGLVSVASSLQQHAGSLGCCDAIQS